MILLSACTKVSECLAGCWKLFLVWGLACAFGGFWVAALAIGAHSSRRGIRDGE